MKRIFFLPRLTTIGLALMLAGTVIVISGISCSKKSVYGTQPVDKKVYKKNS